MCPHRWYRFWNFGGVWNRDACALAIAPRPLPFSSTNTPLSLFNPYNADIFLYKAWRPKDFFQFEIIINVLASQFSLHLNTYVMCLHIINILICSVRGPPLFIRIRVWPLKMVHALKGSRPYSGHSTDVKTHHHIIFFVRPRHSKPGMAGSYCWLSTGQLSWYV